MYEEKTLAEQFCRAILQLNVSHSKALANLVMALASYKQGKSVVALSESPLFHHQYSSITDAISSLARTTSEYQLTKKEIQKMCLEFFPVQSVYEFHSDGVSVFREHSPCLKERGYAHKANNVVVGNKPVGIGYNYSFLNLGESKSSWSLPFDVQRIGPVDDFLSCAASQIERVLRDEDFPFHLSLVVNAADSGFGNAKYIAPTSRIENLVNVVRLRHGMKVYPSGAVSETGGAPQVYGEELFLIEESDEKIYRKKEKSYKKYRKSIIERSVDEFQELNRETKKGRKLRIEVRRWNQMMLRSKHGKSMKETIFDIVGIRVFDAVTDKRVFKQDMFLSVVGERRKQLSLEEVFEKFRHRFDLEVTNRFLKQNLKLQKYQTPDVRHLDNWVLVVQQAMWLLFAASNEVESVVPKWQKYSEPARSKNQRKTASQTHKASERLFLTFESEAFLPKKCKKGVGRRVGEKQEKRESYKVVKKGLSREINSLNEELRE